MQETKASRRVKEDIKRYTHNPIEAPRALALRANSKEKTKVATRRQIAAARRNIKKAQAAKRGKNPRRRKRRAKRRRRRNAAAAPVAKRRVTRRVTRAANDWPNDRRGHRRAALKGHRRKRRRGGRKRRKTSRRRRRNPVTTANERVRVVKIPGATKVVTRQANPHKRRRYKRRRNPTSHRQSGMLGGLMSNPAGPFTAASLRRFAVAAGGIGFGLVVAGALDRYVATRTPDDDGDLKGVNPWYGRDAAAAIARRPDAMRLGAQAAGAVGAMALAYWTRRGNILPFLLGGTAVGFGANLFKQLTDWWIMPAVLSVKDPAEKSLGNRLYALEQGTVQDEIDTIFENWASTPSLAGGQTETPLIQSPLASANPTAGVYALGKDGNGHPESGGISGTQFINTGRLGACTACGGDGGCWASCSDYTGYVTANCPGCPPNAMDRAMYTVQSGDNLESMLSMSQTDINMLNHLNGNIPPAQYWQVGKQVTVPFNLGRYIDEHSKTKAAAGLAGTEESVPPPITPPNGDNQEQSVHSILND